MSPDIRPLYEAGAVWSRLESGRIQFSGKQFAQPGEFLVEVSRMVVTIRVTHGQYVVGLSVMLGWVLLLQEYYISYVEIYLNIEMENLHFFLVIIFWCLAVNRMYFLTEHNTLNQLIICGPLYVWGPVPR